jgi:hypothetical protein
MATTQKLLTKTALAALSLTAAQLCFANCWTEASTTYNIPVAVLAAVAKAESGFNHRAVHLNANRSRDIGLMQINDSHLPELARYGITSKDLFDACTNLKVGAWILSTNATRLGWNWNAIGAYNVGCAKLDKQECTRRRNSYAMKIHRALMAVSAPTHKIVADVASPARLTLVSTTGTATTTTVNTPIAIPSVEILDYQYATTVTAQYTAPAPRANLNAAPIVMVRLGNSPELPGDGKEPTGDWYNDDALPSETGAPGLVKEEGDE